MSGDVQPRKRKDKRRKKADGDYHIQRIRGSSFDEDDSGTPPPTLVNPSPENSTERLTIHVHKEGGTGGHWCARIIFFALLSVLAGLVGLIIFEHRGSTDIDTPITDSRWAMIFDGWVDDSIPHQEEEEPHEKASEETDEHDDEETEEDEKDHDEEEEEEGEEEEEEGEPEENVDSPEVDKEEDEGIGSDEEAEEEEEENEEEDKEEEEEGEGSEGDENEDDEGQQSVEEEIFRQNEAKLSREKRSREREYTSKDEEMENDDEGFEEENSSENDEDFGALEELEEISDEDTNENGGLENVDSELELDDDNEDEEDDDEEEEQMKRGEGEAKAADNSPDDDLDVSIEGVSTSPENEEDDDISQGYFSIPGVGEIDDDSAEPLEEIEDGDLEEIVNDLEAEQPDEEQEIEEESTSVAVKFGVGVALIVAGHFVLVRRWNNVDADLAGSYSDEIVDLSRRNTIVPPLNPKDLITTNKTDDLSTIEDVKIVETYEELKGKYENLESSPGSKKIGDNLQLRNVSMQEKLIGEALSKVEARRGQKEEETDEMQTSESERQSATEPEEAEEEDDDDEEASEEGDEEEDEEMEDEEVEEPDDSELVAKLEAKYGKLPTPTESEDEEDYEDEEEEEKEEDEDEAEEDDEEIRGWKRVRSPKGPHGAKVEPSRDVRGKAQAPKAGSTSGHSGGKNIHESVNDSSIDEISIQDEINNWLTKEFDN